MQGGSGRNREKAGETLLVQICVESYKQGYIERTGIVQRGIDSIDTLIRLQQTEEIFQKSPRRVDEISRCETAPRHPSAYFLGGTASFLRAI